MDIRCPNCSEPWDHDELHYAAEDRHSTYERVAADFRVRGCPALGGTCNRDGRPSVAAQAAYELLGDDMDGAAAMLADADLLGLD